MGEKGRGLSGGGIIRGGWVLPRSSLAGRQNGLLLWQNFYPNGRAVASRWCDACIRTHTDSNNAYVTIR